MKTIDREGSFRCQVIEWGVREGDKGSVMVVLKCQVFAMWDQQIQTWTDWSGFDKYVVWTQVTVVKNDASMHSTGVEQLRDAVGWDGDFLRFQGVVPDHHVVVAVREETFKGKAEFKGSWLYGPEHVPGTGGVKNAAGQDRLEALNAMLGSQLRAVIGAAKTPTPF